MEVVKFLLTYPAIDPSLNDNAGFIFAYSDRHTAVVELLLKDSHVDPATINYEALKGSCENGYLEVINLLMNDPRINI